MRTTDLLAAWRDALRATELAESLARVASEAAADAVVRAEDAEQLAVLAENAAAAALKTAQRARAVAEEAARKSRELAGRDETASLDAGSIHQLEVEAREAYHEAEARRARGTARTRSPSPGT